MATSVDDTTVARVTMSKISGDSNPITGTTASFTAPANSLLVVCSGSDTTAADTNSVVTVSNNGAALTWTKPVERNGADGSGGHACIARALVASERTGLTVTVSVSSHGIAADGDRGSFKVYIVTGHNTTAPDGNVAENSSTTNNISGSVTVAGAGRLFGCATDWNALGAPTSTDVEDAFTMTALSGLSAYKSADHASGSQSINFDAAAGTPDWNWVVYEVVAGAGGGGTVIPVLMHQYRQRRT